MIDLYYWPTPNGHKIVIALEEFGLLYQIKSVNILMGEQHDPAFLAISPNNRVPVIVDFEGPNGTSHPIFESGAILLYLTRKTGLFWPEDPVQQSLEVQWLFFQCANIGPMFGQCGHFRGYADEQVPYAIKRYSGEVQRLYGLVDRQLAMKEFITGDTYGIVDMATYPWMHSKQQALHGVDVTKFPNIERWLSVVESRPAVQRGIAVMEKDLKVGNPTAEAKKAFFNRT